MDRNYCGAVATVQTIVLLLFTSSLSTTERRVRVAGSGSTRCSGRVEVYYNNSWGTVCEDGWDVSDAQVVCGQLGCGTAVGATDGARFGRGNGQIWLDEVSCSGSESSLYQCSHGGFGSHDCYHNKDAGVVCSASLPKPSIFVSPSEVIWGQSVYVTCYIVTGFTGGTFTLRLSDQDVQRLNSKRASFYLSRVTFDNDGPYHCQYQKNISGQYFNSPQSDAITLKVSVSSVLIAALSAVCVLLIGLMFLLLCVLRKRRPRVSVSAPNQLERESNFAGQQKACSNEYEVTNAQPIESCEICGEYNDSCEHGGSILFS